MPALAVTAGVQAGTSIIGGILGNSAAKKAAAVQKQAANDAADSVVNTTAGANPQIGEAAKNAGDRTVSAAGTAASEAGTTARNAAQTMDTATGQANSILDPYTTTGQTATGELNKGLAAGGDFNRTPTMADIQIDPGFAWRLQQGQMGLDRSAAARGGAISGAAAKDMNNYSQGAASQEYANAFSRYNDTLKGRYDRLYNAAGQGITAGTTQGNNLTGAARYGGDAQIQANEFGGNLLTNANEYAGTQSSNAANTMASNTIGAAKTAADYRTGGAAAQAAGIVGGTNALTSGISSGANTLTQAVIFNKLRNPALGSSGGGFGPAGPPPAGGGGGYG